MNLTVIELCKEDMEFASGHFTIFSATQREKLHGHNFKVEARLEALISDDLGMAFDYRVYKQILRKLCKHLDHFFLLPTQSPYLKIEEDGDYYQVYFNNERLPFLKSDVLLLPLANITVEQLGGWFIAQLTEDKQALEKYAVQNITVKIFSSPGQGAEVCWKKRKV